MGNREQQIKYPSRKIPKNKKELKLATFLDYLKYSNDKKKLSKEEIKLCESIPGWKWEQETTFVSKDSSNRSVLMPC